MAKNKPVIQETAWSDVSFFANNSGYFETYRPDELVARKGKDIYRKMLRDPQVKAAFNLTLNFITSRNFRFAKDAENPLHEKMESFFLHNIEKVLKGSFASTLNYVLMSKAYGYSVSEKNFIVKEYGGKDYWFLKNVKPKPFDSFVFKQDQFGNIKKLEQEIGSGILKLNAEKFIIHITNQHLDYVYGESDLRAAYRAFWEKDNISKMWNIYIEKLASGFLVATPNEMAAALDDNETNQFERILSNVSQGTSVRMPAGWDLKVVQAASTDAYERAVQHKDLQIAKALMVPNLLGFSENGGAGSLAQAEVHFNAFMKEIDQQSDELADTLNEQVFKQLAWWNFGTDDFPIFSFEEITNEQKKEMVKSWIEAVKNGVVQSTIDDENRTRELLEYDRREKNKKEETGKDESAEKPNKKEIDDSKREEKEAGFASTNLLMIPCSIIE